MTCMEIEALAAELALGTVSGAERAAALAHLAGCESCRGLVDELARTADSILLLAPPAEPPPGFESAVLARMVAAAQPVPLRPARRRLWVGAAAVALVAAMSGAAVVELRHRGDGGYVAEEAAGAAGVRTALVRDAGGRWTCRAVVYGDNPTWLVVSLDRTDGANAAFSVEAVPVGATEAVPVGHFTIADGHGSLATTVDLEAGRFGAVRVVDSAGKLRYEATFAS